MNHPLPTSHSPGLHHHRWTAARAAVLGLAGALVLSACATVPAPPTAKLQAAELAIGNADTARITDQSSPELSDAREKLTAARLAVEQEQMVVAARLADESRASAELASARSELLAARTVNEEMQKNLDTLKLEMQRREGVSQ
ncbi:DUF4398 domain-containing protein [Panacagrimonas sp.]|uniref:DUF4398 domain-containing protein n=1 Tax=Panacagrimonas sp. TaxID=2480088 RepID=UPI003B51AFB9